MSKLVSCDFILATVPPPASSPSLELLYPTSLLPILPSLFYPLVSPPQKAIINLHFITQLQEEKEAKEAESTTSTQIDIVRAIQTQGTD